MSSGIKILELVSACLGLAEQSGDIIRDVFKSGDLNTKWKGQDDPMTIADLRSQQHIIGGLRNRWSSLNIVGEENCEIPPTDNHPVLDKLSQYESQVPSAFASLDPSKMIIFIDPLDATREFTKGNVQCVMTLIGISYEGKPIAGVIYQPFVDTNGNACDSKSWVGRSVWAVVGMPVVSLSNRRAKEDEGLVIAVTSASHADDKVEKALGLIKPDKIIRTGGAGFKTLMVIERLADVYVFPTVGSKLWDICAPHAILLAVGGTLTDPFGVDIIYSDKQELIENKHGIVITIGDHQRYINLLNNKSN